MNLDDALAASDAQTTTSAVDTKTNSDYQAQRILKSSSAYDMANILRDVIQHGTGQKGLKLVAFIRGKQAQPMMQKMLGSQVLMES